MGTVSIDLTSLEPMIRRYSTKAWQTVPRAKRGADPNTPREPGYFGVHVLRAARIVDVILGANAGVLDSAFEESEGELSARSRALVAEHPAFARIFDQGIDAVYHHAGLTRGESDCVRYQHSGITQSGIADLTGRQLGTVKALLSRAHGKLKDLATPDDAEGAATTSFDWNINLGELPTHPSTSNVRHYKVSDMGQRVAAEYGRCQVIACEFEAAGCTKRVGAHIDGFAEGGDSIPHNFLSLCAVHHAIFDTGIGLDLASLWVKPWHHPERYVGGQLRATVA